jgi:hypothetical protein
MCCIHKNKIYIYITLEKNEIPTRAITEMKLEIVMLNKISWTQKYVLYDCTYMKYLEETNS